MAHLSLQIGAAIPVPVGLTDRPSRGRAWRQRALQEAAIQASPDERWPADQLGAGISRAAQRKGGAHAVTLMKAE